MVTDLKEDTGAATAGPAQRSVIWQKTFPGLEDQPGRVRAELAVVLRAHPDLDEILLVASELCTNPNLRPVGLAHPALTCGYLPAGGRLDREMYSVKYDNPGQIVRYWSHEAQVGEHASR